MMRPLFAACCVLAVAGCGTTRPSSAPSAAADAAIPVAAAEPVGAADGQAPDRGRPSRLHGVRSLQLEPAADAALADAPPPQTMRIHFINLGQGNATLFEFKCGLLLVDTGGEQADVPGEDTFDSVGALKAYLDQVFAARPDLNRTIDVVILTHPHIDHTRGTEMLRQQFTIRNVVDNSQAPVDRWGNPLPQTKFRNWAKNAAGVKYFGVKNQQILSVDGLTNDVIDPIGPCPGQTVDPKISVMWGFTDLPGEAWTNENNQSVVVRVQFDKFTALLTGDLQTAGIQEMIAAYDEDHWAFDVDLYQVGHHGSHNATTAALVELMTPKIAVFSMSDPARTNATWVGYKYGHPNHAAVKLLLRDYPEGVQCSRAVVKVPVGIKGYNPTTKKPPVFEEWDISAGLFGTGWDGTVVVDAKSDGSFAVVTETGSDVGLSCD